MGVTRAALALLILAALPAVPAHAAEPPTTKITAPKMFADRVPGDAVVRGTSAAAGGVVSVRVAIHDIDRDRWWQGDDWGSEPTWLDAELDDAGAKRTDWRLPWDASSGSYRVRAAAEDADGRRETPPAQNWFDVSAADADGYTTLLFGRTQWAMLDPDCTVLEGSVPLGEVAAALAERGLAATGAVVVEYADAGGPDECDGLIRYAGWDQLAELRDRYGWTFTSAGATYTDFSELTPEEQRAQSCGSLATFESHGHDRAWGLFAYPGNSGVDAPVPVQADVVSDCFAFGRTYHWGRNHRGTTAAPWVQRTLSVDGGACRNPELDCHDLVTPVFAAQYQAPKHLARILRAGGGEWSSVQFYRLVRGQRLEGDVQWDCTSDRPRDHWTNRIELYCFDDFLTAVDGIDDETIVADPVTVARAWERAPGSAQPGG
jgi:hypothetical protein